jgi:hypothetical protein
VKFGTCEKKEKPDLFCADFAADYGKAEKAFENLSLGLGMLFAAMDRGGKVVEVTRTGVVRFPDDLVPFVVNSEDILLEVEKKVMEKKPVVDHNGQFAAKVTVRVEILGDLQEGVKPV